jgi:hypothetical protein
MKMESEDDERAAKFRFFNTAIHRDTIQKQPDGKRVSIPA